MGAGASLQTNRRGALPGALYGTVRWGWLLCIPGGALWALSPLGVHLSELKFKTPDVFWKLFPFAPLLLAVGLVGLYLWRGERWGTLAKAGFWAALGGIALILAGDVGLYYLDLDGAYIMAAPAYRTFRAGLAVFAAGSVLLGVGSARDGLLPPLGALPFAIAALAGLAAVSKDMGPFGTVLWMSFGIGWSWLACVLLVGSIVSFRRARSTNT